ncbi:hypothetical protein FQA39_LY07042 [Lamprigera yunnana]|nr:hypothetical protein FQA39_LY07042 [Lamprigera yunnana]
MNSKSIKVRDDVKTFLDETKSRSVPLHLGAIMTFDTDSSENNTVDECEVEQSIDLPWSIPEDYKANNEARLLSLEFTTVYPESPQYYKLFPISTKKNTIIISPKPYLALKNIIQYMDQQCVQIEKIFLCDGEDLRFDHEDCVTKFMQNEQQTCNKTVIERPKLIINVISNENI